MIRSIRSLRFVAALLAVSALAAAPRPSGAVEVSFERDPSVPIVYLNVAVRAGTVTDPEGQSGITNFMGEMLLRGTTSRTKEQLDQDLDQIGAQLEVETRAEALILRGAVLTSQLDRFLKILSEIVTKPRFPEAEIRKLKAEVGSQILEELGRDPTLATRRFTRELFGSHPYGKPILGQTKDIERLSEPQIRAHYDKLFRDRLLLVLGTGDADPRTIQAWAEGLASQRPGGSDIASVPAPQPATERRLFIIDKPDRTQTQIHVGQIGVRMTDPSYFPLYVGNFAFGGGSFESRLMQEVRVKRGWSYGASSSFRHGRQPRSWTLYTFPASKDTVGALGLVLGMVEKAKAEGISEAEYDFARESLINSAGFMSNTPQKRVENRLLERTLDLPDGFMSNYGPRIAQVQLAQVNQALKDYLKPEALTISVLATAKDLKEPLAKAAGVPLNTVVVKPYTRED